MQKNKIERSLTKRLMNINNFKDLDMNIKDISILSNLIFKITNLTRGS
jgi:hypothetical protein